MESTNSKFFTYLVGFSGLLISSVAAFFSVTGIAQLFSGSFWSVVVMAGSLEFGKLVAASFIYRYWNLVNWLQKMYTVMAVVVLIGITSMGIFGFLSNSYMGATVEFESMITKLEVYKEQLVTLEEDKDFLKQELEASVNALPDNYVTAKRKIRNEYNPLIQEKSIQIGELKNTIGELEIQMVDTGVDVGPLIYISETFGTDMDTTVGWIMFILILVFDPLAVLIIISFNIALINSASPKTKRKLDAIKDFIDDKVIKKKDRELYSEPRGPLFVEKKIKKEEPVAEWNKKGKKQEVKVIETTKTIMVEDEELKRKEQEAKKDAERQRIKKEAERKVRKELEEKAQAMAKKKNPSNRP